MYKTVKVNSKDKPKLVPHLEFISNGDKYTHIGNTRVHHLFVTKNGDEVVAFGGLTCFHGHWCLRTCFVAPKHRGHGIQRKLIDARVNYVKKHYPNARHINVWVGLDNEYSAKNVLARGFTATKEHKEYDGVLCAKYRKIIR